MHADPKIAAKMHCDKHVVKMILESVQMLCTTLHYYGMWTPYKPTHINHPCTIWVRQSLDNFKWLHILARELHREWQYRWEHDNNHLAWDKWLLARANIDRKPEWPRVGITIFAQAMPDKYKCDNAVTAYRNYYLGEKRNILKYTKRERPEWIIDG